LTAAATGLAMMIIGRDQVGVVLPIVNVAGFIAGGALLAVGWTLAATRDQAGLGGAVGGALLAAAFVFALTFATDASGELWRGVTTTSAIVACLFLHLGTLEKADFGGTRLAAMLSLLGLGGILLSFVNQWELPAWLTISLGWAGFGGFALFGLALAVASIGRLREG
jgi:hypothetical protein